MLKNRLKALLILIVGVLIGFFVYKSEMSKTISPETQNRLGKWVQKFPFKLGLDLKGGSHLVYRADTSKITNNSDIATAMNSLRDVIERRINIFGVSEPVIQTQEPSFSNNNEHRLTVDLPGVTDINEAIKTIGETPNLQFKTENPDYDPKNPPTVQATVGPDGKINMGAIDPYAGRYIDTPLTGQYLKQSTVQFNQQTLQPIIALNFNDEGSKLFEEMTTANVGKTIAIYLDGQVLSAPVVNQAISGGQATITGSFTPQEAKTLVGRLNSGALPIPIELISTQSIGPTLGAQAVSAGLKAGLIAFLFIALFFILWYRLPGVLAVLALAIYAVINLALFKLIPVTLTAPGIAGFIISLGIAVDANVLIFERIKEEMRTGKNVTDSIHLGFNNAWSSIRDSNISTIITSIILFWFGTSLIKGFALTLGIGVLVSLFSAITATRLFLYSLGITKHSKVVSFLFGSGFSKAR